MVAGRPDEAAQAAGADRRQVVGRAGPQPGEHAPRARARARPGTTSDIVAQQLEHAARGRAACPSRAPPSSRRARSGRRRAGRGRRRAPGSCARRGRRPCGSRRRSTWPLTGRTGTASGTPSQPPRRARRRRARPASAASSSPPASATPVTRSPSCRSRVARAPGITFTPARRDGRAQRGHELARVDGVVAGDVERQPHRRRERRLGAARGARQQPLDGQPEALAEREQPVELLGLVAVARDHERARLPVAGIEARELGQLGAEGGEPGGGAQRRGRAARPRRTRASVTGASMPAATCQAPGSPASSTATPQPALRRAPRASRGRSARRRRPHTSCSTDTRAPSLRRHDPDQVRRSAARCRPLSPIAGSRMPSS